MDNVNANAGMPQQPAPQPPAPESGPQYQPENDPNRQAAGTGAKGRKKKKTLKFIVRLIIILAVIALGTFLILWVVMRAGKYESIRQMLDQMFIDLDLMWKRIRN